MVNVVELARGKRVVPPELTGITATTTSHRVDNNEHNAIIIYADFTAGSGTFSVKIQGRSPGGNYIDMYDQNGNQMVLTGSADKAQLFVGIPYDFKLVATEDVDGATITVSYELFSV